MHGSDCMCGLRCVSLCIVQRYVENVCVTSIRLCMLCNGVGAAVCVSNFGMLYLVHISASLRAQSILTQV